MKVRTRKARPSPSPNSSQVDPSRTGILRRQMRRGVEARFSAIARESEEVVARYLAESVSSPQGKVQGFMAWFDRRVDEILFSSDDWWLEPMEGCYEKGVSSSFRPASGFSNQSRTLQEHQRRQFVERVSRRPVRSLAANAKVEAYVSGCGAGAPGRPGFLPGNTCGATGGGSAGVVAKRWPGVDEALAHVFGRNLSDAEVLSLTGADALPPPTQVVMDASRSSSFSTELNQVNVTVLGPGYSMTRYFYQNKSVYVQIEGLNEVKCVNSYFALSGPLQGKGLGTKVFASQVEALQKVGATKIYTHAAGKFGDKDFNGYYTWPSLGYDCKLDLKRRKDVPDAMRRIKSVQELFSLPGGREWWKANGRPKDMEFDLRTGSKSLQVLEATLRRKGLAPPTANAARPLQEDPGFGPDEMAAMDAAWAEMVQWGPYIHPDPDSLPFQDDDGDSPTANAEWSGPNCGTGAGGFKPGNTCGAGGGSGGWGETHFHDYGEQGRLNLLAAGYDGVSIKFGTTEYRLVLDPRLIVVEPSPTANAALRDVRGRFMSERVNLLATRLENELRGATTAMSQQVARELISGIESGSTPRQIARRIAQVVDGIKETRAMAIANTELVRAHAEGQLDAMAEEGVERVTPAVEWTTAATPCKLCQPLKGIVVTLEEARGMIPRHVNCRCAWRNAASPRPPSAGRRKLAKSSIERAIVRSLREEGEVDFDDEGGWGSGESIQEDRPITNEMLEFSRIMNAGTADAEGPR